MAFPRFRCRCFPIACSFARPECSRRFRYTLVLRQITNAPRACGTINRQSPEKNTKQIKILYRQKDNTNNKDYEKHTKQKNNKQKRSNKKNNKIKKKKYNKIILF